MIWFNLLIFLVLIVAITALNFVLKVGGKSRVVGFALGFTLLFSWVSHILTFSLYPWTIFVSVVAFLLISKDILKLTNELWVRFGVILEQTTIPGTLSKLASIALLLKLKFISLFLADHKEGKISISLYAINFPNYLHFKALVEEIFISREYAVLGLGEAPFIIDCGANIGFTTLFLKKMYPQAKIICFEPDPTSFAFLKKNIEGNQLKKVSYEQKALALEQGFIKMSVGNHTESSTFFLDETKQVYSVPAVKLSDSIIEVVDLLKIDVEGAESQIMQDLNQSRKFSLIKNIIMEYHYSTEEQNFLAQSLSYLEAWGFSYEIRVSSNFYMPYSALQKQTKKLQMITIFACNQHLKKEVERDC